VSGRRIEISGIQVAASVLATVSGAIVASYLGIAGTLLGAALGSAATTAGTAIYRHYLATTKDRLQTAKSGILTQAAHLRQRESPDPVRATARLEAQPDAATATMPARAGGRGADAPQAVARLAGLREAGRIPAAADGDRDTTAAGPAADDPDATNPMPARTTGTAATGNGAAGTAATGTGATGTRAAGTGDAVASQPTGPLAAQTTRTSPVTGGPSGEPARTGRGWPTRKGWLMLAGAAVGIFVVAMAVVTLIETATGKPLDAVIWQRHQTGTTVGNAVGGGGSGQQPAKPARSPTPSPSPSTSPSGSPSPSPSPSPSRSPSPSPSPANPSGTPPASPSPSGLSSLPASTGQAR
jgi:hypothetical protein